ncbi:hypothetical protein EJ05DRAFT_538972 [Pseudovirgaria hyperparasitica]|uniref:Malate dehydrogenase n=1 Tax=Pseudovirgaria hyperparasitica TaxID=470096 RepID=A0A6A6W2M4_9PEZI|nr:uncharacterized protein EJ05DRAFT_538972 [Pseudovirgaria hyperparasitica]KAF2756833.1 hypothetical protein EJ05DRAFT_538972 [Pseudovirgaria hyperparasitica]
MRCSSILTLVAAIPLVAALPGGSFNLNWLDSIARRGSDALRTGMAVCDPSQAQLPQGFEALGPPSEGLTLAHVALGRGTQNYTCDTSNPSSAPKAGGAIATLFNMTCAAAQSSNLIHWLPRVALSLPVPVSTRAADNVDMLMSGHHLFTSLTTPFFNLDTANHEFGTVMCDGKNAVKTPAPGDAAKGYNGLGSVPWLRLTAVEGNYKEVYRVDTAGGVAPKTCDGQAATFQVQYAANYYFYH